MHRGYLVIWRKFFKEHPFWSEKRKFSKAEAWLDILQKTYFGRNKSCVQFVNGRQVEVSYGQCIMTTRYCARRWGWHKNAVRRFFKNLEKMEQIGTATVQQMTRITVLNYEKYDIRRDGDGPETGKLTAQQRPSNVSEYKTINIKKIIKTTQGLTGEKAFMAFWDLYPRKQNRPHTLRIWQELERAGQLPPIENVLMAIYDQLQSDQWQRDGGRFIPSASTWLNAEGWNDQLMRHQKEGYI